MNSTSLLHWISRARWNFSPLFLLCEKDGLLINLVTHEDRFPEVRCLLPRVLLSNILPAASCCAEPAPGNQQDPWCFNTRAPESSCKQEKQREMFIHICFIKRTDPSPPNVSAPAAGEGFSESSKCETPLHNGCLNPNMLLLSLSLTLCSYISTPANDIPLKSNLLFSICSDRIICWKETGVYTRTSNRNGLSFPKYS